MRLDNSPFSRPSVRPIRWWRSSGEVLSQACRVICLGRSSGQPRSSRSWIEQSRAGVLNKQFWATSWVVAGLVGPLKVLSRVKWESSPKECKKVKSWQSTYTALSCHLVRVDELLELGGHQVCAEIGLIHGLARRNRETQRRLDGVVSWPNLCLG